MWLGILANEGLYNLTEDLGCCKKVAYFEH